jgi:hypothetical protein
VTDVLQTYLLFLRVELLRGKLDKAGYEAAITAVKEDLKQRASNAGADNFLLDFLQRWEQAETQSAVASRQSPVEPENPEFPDKS